LAPVWKVFLNLPITEPSYPVVKSPDSKHAREKGQSAGTSPRPWRNIDGHILARYHGTDAGRVGNPIGGNGVFEPDYGILDEVTNSEGTVSLMEKKVGLMPNGTIGEINEVEKTQMAIGELKRDLQEADNVEAVQQCLQELNALKDQSQYVSALFSG
jgi:hypothetical protein